MTRTACIFIALTSLGACSSADSFQRSLEQAASRGAESITLRNHTDFEWDTVHVYGPYAPFDRINERHNLSLKRQSRYLGDFVSEGECLYVFSMRGSTVRTSVGSRHCDGILKPGVYSSREAVFAIKRDGSRWNLVASRSNSRLERTAGSHSLAAATQPER
jgi:hypothetical protein